MRELVLASPPVTVSADGKTLEWGADVPVAWLDRAHRLARLSRKSVIEADANRKVTSLQDFIGLIGEAFQKNWIDPDNPHRHQDPGETT